MGDDLRRRLIDKSAPVTFRATLGLIGATTLGVGALMGAGLYVLVGVAAAEAGPGLWLAYAICGALTLLSALLFADFARRMPVAGGGYVYAYRQLGSLWGFLVGWHLAVGSVFACALYAWGFGSYLGTFLPAAWAGPRTARALAALIVVGLALLALRGGRGGDRVQRVFTWGNLVVLLVLAAVALPFADGGNFAPMFPRGVSGVTGAISLIYISFFGYQLVANSAEEIRDPPRTVPRAIVLSLVVAAFFYLVVVLVAVAAVDWRELAASDAPLVVVAARGLGRWGVALIAVGGVLASLGALNSTLVSQARQIYAMGRDRLLPEVLAGVTERARVPAAALLCGAAAVVLAVVLADLAFIAKAANFALLVSMLPVSVALDALYRRRAAEERIPLWRRVVPWAALVANAAILLTLDVDSLLFGGLIVGAGALVFLMYSFSAEKRGRAGLSVDLAEERPTELLQRGERILVPMSNPRTQESLFSISQALMPPGGGEIVVLKVVPAEGETDLREALRRDSHVDQAVQVIERAAEVAQQRGVTFRPVVRAARNLAEGIHHAAIEQRCRVVVMGWASREDDRPSELLEEVVARVRADLVFLQLTHDVAPRRVGVALGSRANLPLMVRVGTTLADQYAGEVSYLSVVPESFDHENLRHVREVQIEAIGRHQSLVPFRTEVLRSDNPLAALVERSRELDMLVVGSAPTGPFAPGSVGGFSSVLARQSHCTVVIVRTAPKLGRLLVP